MKDIAEKAGVSIGTVDRVLHERGEVKEETRKKIMKIIEEIGYTPNLLAKSLALKKNYHIAAIIPDASDNNPYWEKPLNGIKRGAEELIDYNTIVDVYTFNATQEDSYKRALKEVSNTRPAGVILNPVFKAPSIDFTKELDLKAIPYVYVDIDLESGNNLAYFGQDAKQSGKVAAKVLSYTLPDQADILLLKLAKHKIVTSHIERREEGFLNFFSNLKDRNYNIISEEIDLSNPQEPGKTLQMLLEENKKVQGIFVPSSRVFKVAEFFEKQTTHPYFLLGYDLVDLNVEYLNKQVIDLIISQKPEQQGYNSVMALFDHIVSRKKIEKTNYSQIDIIIKENLEYYNQS